MDELTKRIQSTNLKLASRYKKLTKQRELDHAVLYLVQHPDLINEDPITTERLLLCCWCSKNTKNLTLVLDMLIEASTTITLEELGEIVISYLKSDFRNKNIHKYIHYLCYARGYKLDVKAWKEYLSQFLASTIVEFNNKISGYEEIQQNVIEVIRTQENIYLHNKDNAYFSSILETTLRDLESYMRISDSENERQKKRELVFRPLFLSIITKKMSIASLLVNNEVYNKLIVDELYIWGCENEDFFKAIFMKLDFKSGLLPWSVFKALKNQLKEESKDELYFYVTKYFMDNMADDEEICNYVFTNKEYKELIKYFLNHCDELKEGGTFSINDKNEAEFEGFVIV